MSDYSSEVYEPAIAYEALRAFGIADYRLGDPYFGSNVVVRVEAASAYALRLHRARSVHAITRELEVIIGLHAAGGLVVAPPVADPQGRYCRTVHSNGRGVHCTLLRWLPGASRGPGNGFGPVAARQTGEALGQIHRYARSRASRGAFEDDLRLSRLIGDADELTEQDVRLRELLPELQARCDQLIALSPEVGTIHGDFILKNLLIRRGSVAVLDFDDCCTERMVFDFAGLLENLDGARREAQLVDAVLEGYAAPGPPAATTAAAVREHTQSLKAVRHLAGIRWAVGMRAEGRIEQAFFERVTTYRGNELRRLLS